MRRIATALLTAVVASWGAQQASALIQITEWMYNPASGNGEFFELTNRGALPVDLTGWSFDDSSRAPGSMSLSSLGTVAAGESVLITELTDAAFRTEWGLAPSVKVLGGNTNNLSRDDEINIYDAANALVDRLTYNDQGTGNVDGPRTLGVSGNPSSLSVLGTNNASQWVLSVAAPQDIYGSVVSGNNNVGNPGKFLLVPEPSALGLAVMALLAWRRRRAA